MTLQNPSFEDGWSTFPSNGNQEPHGWALTWRNPGDPMLSAYAFPGEPDPLDTVLTVPECVHKLASQLPPNEQPGAPDALILDGVTTYKVFGVGFSATLHQGINDIEPGSRVTFRVPVQVHSHDDGSFGACAFRIWIDDNHSRWQTFEAGLEDREWSYIEAQVTVQDNYCDVGLDVEGRAVAPVSFFVDALELTIEPPAPVCRGLPREQYERRYNVYPNTTEVRRREIAAICADRQETAGPSYDDAGLGDLDNKTAVLWDIPTSERDLYTGFFAKYYPGTAVEFAGDTPEPPPPPQPEPPQFALRSNNCIGLHSGFPREQSFPYIAQSGTNIQKFFSAGDAYRAGLLAPGIVSVWRKFVGNDGISDPIDQHAQWLLDQYSAEIDTTAQALGISVANLLANITAIESLNEQMPTFNPPQIMRNVEFDCIFAEKVHARYGDLLTTVLLNVAVGNPHESEVHYLLPAAQAAMDYGGFLGYHAYWAANETQSFLESGWKYHAGRWQEWDRVFTDNDIFVRYALGEAGICYAADGWSFQPHRGWKSCGPFSNYLRDIDEFNRRIMLWNTTHGNRCAGATMFGYGQWDWPDFEFGDGDVITLKNWAVTL